MTLIRTYKLLNLKFKYLLYTKYNDMIILRATLMLFIKYCLPMKLQLIKKKLVFKN